MDEQVMIDNKNITVRVIQYLREENIHRVQDFFGSENGNKLTYNPQDNEYYVSIAKRKVKLNKGDYIMRTIDGRFAV